MSPPALAPPRSQASLRRLRLGALDDLTGATDVKGLRGHLGELRSGTVTTGSVKLFGLLATGLLVGAAARRGRGGAVDAVLAGGVVAGSANMANLLDLRPGRAVESLPARRPRFRWSVKRPVDAAGSAQWSLAPVGAVAATIGDDLAERAMLGDTGANALGAAWGVGAAASMSRGGLFTTLAALSALTLLSERVSFSQLIEQTPPLKFAGRAGPSFVMSNAEGDARHDQSAQGTPSWVSAALLIAGITVVARIIGFLRFVFLAQTLGTTCLGTAYVTANAVPNIVYELVVGGALIAVVVPLIAAQSRDRPSAGT